MGAILPLSACWKASKSMEGAGRADFLAISDSVRASISIDCDPRDHHSASDTCEAESRKFGSADFCVDERFCTWARRSVSIRLTLEKSVPRIHE